MHLIDFLGFSVVKDHAVETTNPRPSMVTARQNNTVRATMETEEINCLIT